jgi:CHAT domain-containing protein/tetratricopeptide (TPR) repeat protein
MPRGMMLRRLMASVVAGFVLASAAHAQEADDPAALHAEIGRLYAAGKYAEATETAKRVLAIREKALGPDHPRVGGALNELAELYRAQGLLTAAEPLYRRNLAITQKAFGPDHLVVAIALNNLALLYRDQGRLADAEPFFKRSLAITEKTLGPDDPDVGQPLNNLGRLYQNQGRLGEAEPLFKRSLSIREKALGPDHLDVGTALGSLGGLYQDQGRFAEAEPLFKRSLAIQEKTLGLDHLQVGRSLASLALLYQARGHLAEAEPLFKRSLAITEKALGPGHPNLAASLNTLAQLYREQGRFAEAEPLFKRGLSIREKAFGPEHPDVRSSLNNLALLYLRQGRFAEAEPLFKRSLAVIDKALGPAHPDFATALNSLALLHQAQGRLADAEQLFRSSLAIIEKALGPDHPNVGGALSNLAWLAYTESDWKRAADYWYRSTAVIKRRAERGLSGATEGSPKGEAQRLSWQFSGLVKMTHRLAAPSPTAATAAEMFETAPWAQGSEAAVSLAQMAVRSAKGSPELGPLVRERQDLLSERQTKDKLLIGAKSNEPAKRNTDAEKALADRMAAIDTRLAEINGRLAKDFPDHAALASPTPASVEEVQAQLGTDEAVVLFLDTSEEKPLPEESFLWIVTKMEVRWARSELGTGALTREVAALRCGLDAGTWDGAGAERCAQALSISPVKAAPSPLPFDHARAHKLYMDLFGQVQDLIKGKHLLIVPSGPLTQFPFQALVTKPPASGDHRAAAWLAREHAVTILPAVASLKALRRVAGPSTAPKPMIGVGNPLLDGPDARSADRAKLARAKQHCPEALGRWRVTVTSHRASVGRVETRGGLADLMHLKALAPLPETADELCDVAHDVKADLAHDIRLGSRATEREVKSLSTRGELAKYRIVHFATHGAVAGELDGAHEPGLILTPPATASELDDGYLSASEIAALKLDADWVVLSACNTAAGGATNAEALSGLGRAFIYAGARSLLVSHWAVYSEATVKLITGAVGEMARDAKVGRAEAMRRSMLALIGPGSKEEAHPSFWAPFVVVGEGAAGR